jgi:hypothetical protein
MRYAESPTIVDNLFLWRREKKKEVSAVDEHRLMREY